MKVPSHDPTLRDHAAQSQNGARGALAHGCTRMDVSVALGSPWLAVSNGAAHELRRETTLSRGELRLGVNLVSYSTLWFLNRSNPTDPRKSPLLLFTSLSLSLSLSLSPCSPFAVFVALGSFKYLGPRKLFGQTGLLGSSWGGPHRARAYGCS
jgi:hypothetical protein